MCSSNGIKSKLVLLCTFQLFYIQSGGSYIYYPHMNIFQSFVASPVLLALFTYLLQPTLNESGDKSVYSESNVLRILRTFTTHRCGIVDGCDDAIIITRGADRQLGDYTICWYITMGVFDISDLLLIRLSYSYSHQLQHRLENVRHKQNVRTS